MAIFLDFLAVFNFGDFFGFSSNNLLIAIFVYFKLFLSLALLQGLDNYSLTFDFTPELSLAKAGVNQFFISSARSESRFESLREVAELSLSLRFSISYSLIRLSLEINRPF